MILDGRAEFHCGERGSRAGSGTSMLLPKGVPHWLQVAADAPCRSLVLTKPRAVRAIPGRGRPAGPDTRTAPTGTARHGPRGTSR
jgi:hypothetical protein